MKTFIKLLLCFSCILTLAVNHNEVMAQLGPKIGEYLENDDLVSLSRASGKFAPITSPQRAIYKAFSAGEMTFYYERPCDDDIIHCDISVNIENGAVLQFSYTNIGLPNKTKINLLLKILELLESDGRMPKIRILVPEGETQAVVMRFDDFKAKPNFDLTQLLSEFKHFATELLKSFEETSFDVNSAPEAEKRYLELFKESFTQANCGGIRYLLREPRIRPVS